MKIDRKAFEAIQAHGAEGYPDEICGLMLGSDHVVTDVRRARNIIVDRSRDRYEIDPLDQIRIQREAERLRAWLGETRRVLPRFSTPLVKELLA